MINVKLAAKPIPIPINFQPIYKIILLLAVLRYGCSRPYAATLVKLHLYMWALRTDQNRTILIEVKYNRRSTLVPWIFEPSLDKIITLCVINKFCKRKVNTSGILQIELTEEGSGFLKKIEDQHILEEQISHIKEIGVITQTTISTVNKNWRTY